VGSPGAAATAMVWEASDAVALMARTGADGVVVGRGCLGRPWLFAELAAAFAGDPPPPAPDLAGVVSVLRRHAALLCEDLGEPRGCREIRKHIAWYTKGFAVGPTVRAHLGLVSTLAALDDLLGQLDLTQPFPTHVLGRPRGRTTGGRRVALPDGWLDDQDAQAVPRDAELGVSGG